MVTENLPESSPEWSDLLSKRNLNNIRLAYLVSAVAYCVGNVLEINPEAHDSQFWIFGFSPLILGYFLPELLGPLLQAFIRDLRSGLRKEK